ncbi:MAG: hypothetical protein KR126chlam1_00611 [Chlamydiae bacterium]|nr:hypothetical protein [Chlamydiota bacterium]
MIQRSFGTHDGTFHADEVCACALLLIFDQIDRDKIIRSRESVLLQDCEYVCDVEGEYSSENKRFDHHQLEYKGDLASAGMIWLYLRSQGVVDQALYDYANRRIIMGIDAHDNGKEIMEEGVCTFSHVIAGFVPPAYDTLPSEQDTAFFEALDFVAGHFRRLFQRYRYIYSCKDQVAAAMEKGDKALFFDEAMPWSESFFSLGGETHPAEFVVMPTGEHWKLRGIPPSPKDKMGVRKPLPKQWAGLRDEALREITGIEGAIFCHKGLFISIWETKEDALKALELALKNEDKNR